MTDCKLSDRFFWWAFLGFALVILITYAWNGGPILDQDTGRYTPRYPGVFPSWEGPGAPTFGSVLPFFVNTLPVKYFSHAGIVAINALVICYSFARLASALIRFLEPQNPIAMLVLFVMTISTLTFAPLMAIMVVSESASMGCFALLYAVILNRRVRVPDGIVLLLFSNYHAANIAVLVITLAIASIVHIAAFKRTPVALLLATVLVLLSSALDRTLFSYYNGTRPRMEASFLGSIILNYYPFVADRACEGAPDMPICKPPLRDFIAAKRDPVTYELGKFLWGSTSIVERGSTPRTPTSLKMSIPEFEDVSKTLVTTTLQLIPSEASQLASISMPRIAALFRQNVLYRYNPRRMHNERFETSACRRWFCESTMFDTYSSVVKSSQIFLLPLLMIFCLTRRPAVFLSAKTLYLMLPAVCLYFSNLVLMGVIGTAVSRYHYKAFFLLTLVDLLLVWIFLRSLHTSAPFCDPISPLPESANP